MRINENMPALYAYNSLTRTNRKIDLAMRRLSSGYRINSVKDDAAGLAISNKLHNQILGVDKAERNSMDGVSLVQTAEGAMQEINNMLNRIRELAVQASNDTNEPEDRRKIQDEVAALIAEVDSITSRTEFNKIKLLNGDAQRLGKVADNFIGIAKITEISETVPNGSLDYTIDKFGMPAQYTSGMADFAAYTTAAKGGSLTINGESVDFLVTDTPPQMIEKLSELCERNNLVIMPLNGASWDDYIAGGAELFIYSQEAGSSQRIEIGGSAHVLAALGLSAGTEYGTDAQVSKLIQPAVAAAPAEVAPTGAVLNPAASGTLTINGETMTISVGDTAAQIATAFNDLLTDAGLLYTGDIEDYLNGSGSLAISTPNTGAGEEIVISGDQAVLDMLGLTAGTVTGADAEPAEYGPGATFTTTAGELMPFNTVITGNKIEMNGSNNQKLILELQIDPTPDENGVFHMRNGDEVSAAGTPDAASPAASATSAEITDYGMIVLQIGANKSQELRMQIKSVTAHSLGIDYLNVKSWEGAQLAIEKCDIAISRVSEVRSYLGSYQNRLEYTSNSLRASSENMSLARSRIFDTDMAWEMTQLTQNNVISQAGMAIMAQANQRPQQILQLLQ